MIASWTSYPRVEMGLSVKYAIPYLSCSINSQNFFVKTRFQNWIAPLAITGQWSSIDYSISWFCEFYNSLTWLPLIFESFFFFVLPSPILGCFGLYTRPKNNSPRNQRKFSSVKIHKLNSLRRLDTPFVYGLSSKHFLRLSDNPFKYYSIVWP